VIGELANHRSDEIGGEHDRADGVVDDISRQRRGSAGRWM
jgi:hypothetical protein